MPKSLRTRRWAVKVLAVGAVLGGGLVTGATPAQAAVSNCPQNRMCFYDGKNFTGFRQVSVCPLAYGSLGFGLWKAAVNKGLKTNFRPATHRGVTAIHNRCPGSYTLVGRRARRVIGTGKYIGELGYSHLSNDPTFHIG